MADSRVRIGGEGPLSPDDVARKSFPTTRRGFDPEDVRKFLEAVAAELRRLRERLHELERHPADAPAPTTATAEPPPPPALDIATLTSALGAETARVLRTAQEAAVDLRARAEEGAARALTEAHDEAARVRAQAEGLLAQRTEEADAMASKLRTEVELEVSAARVRADAEADAKIQAAVDRGREMVGEAQAARERMLGDLARRRKSALTQLEQLRAGRERLLDAYRAVRRSLDEITDELTRADAEANAAADAAGRRSSGEGGEEPMPDLLADRPNPASAAAAEPAPPLVPVAPEPAPSPPDLTPPAGSTALPATPTAPPTGPTAPQASHVASPVITAAPPPATAPISTFKPPLPPTTPGDAIPVATLPASAVGLAPDAPTDSKGVDQLFARIRADRAETTVKARETLAEGAVITRARGPEAVNGPGVTVAPDGPTAAPVDEGLAPGVEPAWEAASATADAPSTAADEGFLQRRDALIEPLASSLTKKIKRLLSHEQNVVLDRLRTHRGRLTVDAILPENATHAAPYIEAAATVLEQADVAGTTLAAAIGPVGAVSGSDAAGLHTLAEGLAAELLGPLRHRLERSMDQGTGEDPGEAADAVRSAYRELKAPRIDRMVIDRLTGAVTLGIHRALAAGTMVRWLVDDADGACPDCDDNSLAGPTALGEPFPTGQLGPPAHPGCRCLLGPASA